MSVEELNAQIEELKKTNQDLQDKLKVALDTVEVYTKEELDELIASITDKSEVPEDDLKDKSVEELKAIDAVLSKAKVDYKGVKPEAGDSPLKSGLTVGRWSADEKKWVT
jgi:hypothetical protein